VVSAASQVAGILQEVDTDDDEEERPLSDRAAGKRPAPQPAQQQPPAKRYKSQQYPESVMRLASASGITIDKLREMLKEPLFKTEVIQMSRDDSIPDKRKLMKLIDFVKANVDAPPGVVNLTATEANVQSYADTQGDDRVWWIAIIMEAIVPEGTFVEGVMPIGPGGAPTAFSTVCDLPAEHTTKLQGDFHLELKGKPGWCMLSERLWPITGRVTLNGYPKVVKSVHLIGPNRCDNHLCALNYNLQHGFNNLRPTWYAECAWRNPEFYQSSRRWDKNGKEMDNGGGIRCDPPTKYALKKSYLKVCREESVYVKGSVHPRAEDVSFDRTAALRKKVMRKEGWAEHPMAVDRAADEAEAWQASHAALALIAADEAASAAAAAAAVAASMASMASQAAGSSSSAAIGVPAVMGKPVENASSKAPGPPLPQEDADSDDGDPEFCEIVETRTNEDRNKRGFDPELNELLIVITDD
jgi:hypothetical protein